MTEVTVKVSLICNGKELSDSKDRVRLSDDPVAIAAAGLAYGLVEDMWAIIEEES